VALYEYGGAMAQVLHRLKWQGRDDLAGPLGALLGPRLRELDADLLVPVPLHRLRLRARGYNQAGLLLGAARRAGRATPPVRHDLLCRRQGAPPTRGAGAWRRLQQAQGAFYVPDAAAPALRGRRVLLCDDVVTTGATVQSCASALLGGGAAAVSVLCLCRAAP
jgi:ComF family protein